MDYGFVDLGLNERLELQDRAKTGDENAIKEWTYFCIGSGLKKLKLKNKEINEFLKMIKIEVKQNG